MNIIKLKSSQGTTLIEVLVSIVLFAIMGMALAKSSIYSIQFQKYAEVGNIASNLAVSKAEELSGVNIDDLDDSYDETESNFYIVGHNIPFSRVTDITVNADGSRTIEITVSSTSNYLPNPKTYSTRFAPWES